MAIDINHCMIEGRLGADPESRVLGSGSKMVTARIACNDDYKNRQTGEWVKRSYWISVSTFGYAGDQLMQFTKGERIIVIGKWTVDEVAGRDGGKKTYYNKLQVQEVRGSEIRRDTGNQQQRPAQESRPAATTRQGPGSAPADFDDDIPF